MERQQTILAVDDSSLNLVMLSAMLGNEYRVVTAQDGVQAVIAAVNEKPDLILLDIMLPGKDGFEICTQLKKNSKTRDIPVMFITARADSQSIVKGLSIGACDYVCKPFASDELLNRIKIQLEAASRQKILAGRLQEAEKRAEILDRKYSVLQMMKDNMPCAEMICERNGKIVSASPSCNKVFCYQGEIDGLDFWDIAETEKDRDVLKDFFDGVLEKGQSVLRYVLNRKKGGRKLVLESKGKLLDKTSSGLVVINTENITGALSSQVDVRKNLEFQKDLRLISQTAGGIQGFTSACIYLVNSLMKLTSASEIILLLGRKDKKTEFFYHNSRLKTCKKGQLPPTENDYSGFVRLLKENSGSVICNIQDPYIPKVISSRGQRYILYPIVIGEMLAGVFYVCKNSVSGITQENVYAVATVAGLVKNNINKKIYEKKIIRQEKEISNLFKYNANGIISVDQDFILQRYNRRFLELFDIPGSADFTGRRLDTVLKGQVLKDVVRLIDKVGKPPLFETAPLVQLKEDGSKMYIEATASKITVAGDTICSLVFADVTGLRNIDNAVLTATTLAEEKERTRLAQELHDGLGAQLSSINIYINLILSGGVETSEIFRTLKLTKDILGEAISGVKEIADNLHPVILTRFGLVATINNIIEGLENSRLIKFGFTHSEYVPLEDKNLELNVYRIINELINNTMKHSKAKNTAISLVSEKDSLVLEYADDGVGFDSSVVSYSGDSKSGHGLQNIKARVKAVDGKFFFRSSPGRGFQVLIRIPVLHKEKN